VWSGSSQHAPNRRSFELAPQKVMAANKAVDRLLPDWYAPRAACGDTHQTKIAVRIFPHVQSMIGARVPVAMMGSSMGTLLGSLRAVMCATATSCRACCAAAGTTRGRGRVAYPMQSSGGYAASSRLARGEQFLH
jgi:hypothetical protein